MNSKEQAAAEILDCLLEGVAAQKELLQTMVDSVIAVQRYFPMPAEGLAQFKADIEYTNALHGWNLKVRDAELCDVAKKYMEKRKERT